MKNELLDKEKKLTEKILQGAHDIRAPIASLECMIEGKATTIDSLSSIANDIKEIANDLLYSLKDKPEDPFPGA